MGVGGALVGEYGAQCGGRDYGRGGGFGVMGLSEWVSSFLVHRLGVWGSWWCSGYIYLRIAAHCRAGIILF